MAWIGPHTSWGGTTATAVLCVLPDMAGGPGKAISSTKVIGKHSPCYVAGAKGTIVTSKTTMSTKVETRSRLPKPGHGVRRGMGSGLADSGPISTFSDRGVAAGTWKFTKEWLEGSEAGIPAPRAVRYLLL